MSQEFNSRKSNKDSVEDHLSKCEFDYLPIISASWAQQLGPLDNEEISEGLRWEQRDEDMKDQISLLDEEYAETKVEDTVVLRQSNGVAIGLNSLIDSWVKSAIPEIDCKKLSDEEIKRKKVINSLSARRSRLRKKLKVMALELLVHKLGQFNSILSDKNRFLTLQNEELRKQLFQQAKDKK